MKYKNNINGILCINKPKGKTSREIVNQIQKILNTKAGHNGTLDPIATGVLVITLGKATKLNEIISSNDKEYIATAILGLETDTLDITGKKQKEENTKIEKKQIIEALNHFKGEYLQQVPIYSAVKIKGKKLYEYARENIKVELPKRKVKIYDIKLIEHIYQNKKTIIKFKVKVSKGTYIRSLIKDIAHYLNTYGTMTDLIRTKQGKFDIKNSYTIENIINKNYKLLKIKEVLEIPKVKVDDKEKFKIINGQQLNYNYETVLFLDNQDNELAIYKKDNNKLKVWKML